MGNFSRTLLWMVLLLSLVAVGAQGQWKIMASNLLPAVPFSTSSIDFCDGTIWAGSATNLYSSRDSGKTWQSLNMPGFEFIRDVSFYDNLVGVMATNSGVYRTSDGGISWNDISPRRGPFWQVTFNGSSSVIHAIETDPPAELFTSTNQGQTWRGPYLSGQAGNCLATSTDGMLYVFSNNGSVSNLLGWTNSSSDLGITWSANGSATGGDSYSLAVDSCDNRRLYLANENYANPGDGQSKILLSTDGGSSWQTTFSHGRYFLSGALINASEALYAGTITTSGANGVLRSSDRGLTWTNVGGPSIGADTRGIMAINSNTIFAIDALGNIWATFNSGGNPLHASSVDFTFSATPSTMFAFDTVSCNRVSEALAFQETGCPLPYITGLSVIGNDANNYQWKMLSSDSILLTLSGVGARPGYQNAKLVISLDNGYSDTVSLAGYVNTSAVPLSISTANVKTDTLGATVSVPITINGLTRPEDVDLVLHYDGSVDYLGSFSPTGTKLDVAGEQWPGRSLLHFVGATPGAIAGYATFNVFSDSSENAHATFDSLDIVTAVSPCEYSAPPSATSTISPPKGCGIPILSQLVHLGKEPVLSVHPNPATGSVWVTSSESLSNTTITVYDMLGIPRSVLVTDLPQDIPTLIALPKAAGVYTIEVKSASGTFAMRVVRNQ